MIKNVAGSVRSVARMVVVICAALAISNVVNRLTGGVTWSMPASAAYAMSVIGGVLCSFAYTDRVASWKPMSLILEVAALTLLALPGAGPAMRVVAFIVSMAVTFAVLQRTSLEDDRKTAAAA